MNNVLLIEPDKKLASIYKSALEHSGLVVNHAISAQEAVLVADENTPDIVILEPQLVGHSGIEFLYEFRSYTEWQDIPVIVLALSDLDLKKQLLNELGVVAVLYKPQADLEKLISTVKEHLATVD